MLQTIITLLSMALAMLSANPNAQNNALANQAVKVATQYLAEQSSPTTVSSDTVTYSLPTSTSSTDPIVINVQNPSPILGAAVVSSSSSQTATSSFTSFEISCVSQPVPTNYRLQPCVILFDQNGDPLTNQTSVIISTDNPSLSKPNGNAEPIVVSPNYVLSSPNANGMYRPQGSLSYQPAPAYGFNYVPPSDGYHTISVTADGTTLTQQILSANEGPNYGQLDW